MEFKFFHDHGRIENIENSTIYHDVTIINQDEKGNTQIECNCLKCGGTGKIEIFMMVQDGVCFKCNGSKRQISNLKLYTEDKIQVLAERYKARKLQEEQEALKSYEINKIIELKKGLSIDNDLYIIVEPNSYDIKEELKKEGFKFHRGFNGWYNSTDSENYKTIKMTFDEIYNSKEYVINFNLIKDTIEEYKALNNKTVFLGIEGDKLKDLNLTLDYCKVYDGYAYGSYTYYYNFKDQNGNKVQWKTSKDLELSTGQTVKLNGTIKELKVDNEGNKITVLTRCKVLEIGDNEEQTKIKEYIKDTVNNAIKNKDIEDLIIRFSYSDGFVHLSMRLKTNEGIKVIRTNTNIPDTTDYLFLQRTMDDITEKLGF